MGERATSDAERELRELRARAFGPDPDIYDDPRALARLEELERAHLAARFAAMTTESALSDGAVDVVPATGTTPMPQAKPEPESEPGSGSIVTTGSDRSMWRGATSTTSGRLWLGVGVAVTVIAFAYGVTWIVEPRPDVTMHLIATEPDGAFLRQLEDMGSDAPDPSTLQAYGSYRGIEVWSGVDPWGSLCVLAYEPSVDTLFFGECTPREGEVIGDIGDWPHPWKFAGLVEGSVVRLQLHGNSVDVYVYPAPSGADT